MSNPSKPKAPRIPEPKPPANPPDPDSKASATDLGAFDPVELLEALRHPAFRAWLDGQLAAARATVKAGPGGQGWRFNESKRPGAEAILRAIEILSNAGR